MGVPIVNTGPMTAEEFFAFTQTRPDDERWELIDGDPLLNATASRHHQRIVMNISGMLDRIMIEKQPWWEALPGIGVRLSINSVPVPDILIRPSDDLIGVECEDVIVAFEVLSPSSKSMDLRWKHRAYATLPTLQHYVVVAQTHWRTCASTGQLDSSSAASRAPRESSSCRPWIWPCRSPASTEVPVSSEACAISTQFT